jgi:hypothetical protein
MNHIHHANGVITYTFATLADLPVAAHVSTRHGGVSPEPWRSLNFSILRGDDRDRVLENRRRLAAALDLHADELRTLPPGARHRHRQSGLGGRRRVHGGQRRADHRHRGCRSAWSLPTACRC